ncbi:hypothetical protein M5K25_000267 [Dendrobium thyrsiflorum]|uniref:Uncharacterized protein n=1 Tax=Dendrobium thyrsiflorum TaxID=117978 RepID=A0ABD0VTF8_DENTH
MVYDEQGFIQILQSPFFDVSPEVDHTVEGYVARILDTIVLASEEQLGTVEWRLASDPQCRVGARQDEGRVEEGYRMNGGWNLGTVGCCRATRRQQTVPELFG